MYILFVKSVNVLLRNIQNKKTDCQIKHMLSVNLIEQCSFSISILEGRHLFCITSFYYIDGLQFYCKDF